MQINQVSQELYDESRRLVRWAVQLRLKAAVVAEHCEMLVEKYAKICKKTF
jgi:hypothetical protein